MPNVADIVDRAHARYFSVRTKIRDPVKLDIDTVVFENQFGIPIRLYFLSPLDRLPDQPPKTVFDPISTSDEEGDYYHRDGFEARVRAAVVSALKKTPSGKAVKEPVFEPGQSVSIDAKTLDNPNLWQFLQVKVVSSSTKSVICFWSFHESDVKGKALRIALNHDLMIAPNALRHPPEPSEQCPLPVNSPRIVVNYGPLPTPGTYLVHEQVWRRCHSCFCLAPGEKKTVIFTQRSGVTSISQSEEKIAKDISGNASAGWAGISASVSAALSASQAISSSQTISREVSSELMDETVNPYCNKTIMILGWEIIDIYSVCRKHEMLSSFEVTQVPPVIRHYPKGACPVPPGKPRQLKREEMRNA